MHGTSVKSPVVMVAMLVASLHAISPPVDFLIKCALTNDPATELMLGKVTVSPVDTMVSPKHATQYKPVFTFHDVFGLFTILFFSPLHIFYIIFDECHEVDGKGGAGNWGTTRWASECAE